ncbi:MAG: hypothetical protein WC650_05725 [Candidatus Doudnabacteria bacterium]
MLYYAIPENTVFTVGEDTGTYYQKVTPNPLDNTINRAQKVKKGKNGWVATGSEWGGFDDNIEVRVEEALDHVVE